VNKALFALALITVPTIALAANEIAVVNEVFAERAVVAADGTRKPVLVKAKSGPPGSRLIFVTTYRNQSAVPIRGIILNSPRLDGVVFDGALSPGAQLSVDQGTTWGALTTLRVRAPNGTIRPAQNTDVTHVRLVVAGAAAPGSSGKMSFRVIVK
jgi:hypothetical protein